MMSPTGRFHRPILAPMEGSHAGAVVSDGTLEPDRDLAPPQRQVPTRNPSMSTRGRCTVPRTLIVTVRFADVEYDADHTIRLAWVTDERRSTVVLSLPLTKTWALPRLAAVTPTHAIERPVNV